MSFNTAFNAHTEAVRQRRAAMLDRIAELRALGLAPDVIGGAELAAELDALRAIDQGTRLGLAII